MMCIGEFVMRTSKDKKEHSKTISRSMSTKVLLWFENNMIVFYLLLALLIIGFTFTMFWITKNVSYWLFYENMVQDTIKEMVKPEYLILLK